MDAEQLRAYNRAYHARHREARLAAFRQWKADHRTEHRASAREWQRAHPERAHARKMAWKASNPLAVAKGNQRSQASLASHAARQRVRNHRIAGPDTAVIAFYRRVREIDLLFCAWCDGLAPRGARHVDHVVPLARGGLHDAANLAGSCVTCNLRKGVMPPELFRGRVKP